jgi:rhodanese-related sulfurtransferase
MALTAAQMVSDARARVRNLNTVEVAVELASGEALLVDLREPAELTDQGFIPGAVHAPRGMLEFWADPTSPYHREEFSPGATTILYCASSGRSALAVRALQELGYGDVAHLEGGLKAWTEAGRPVTYGT